MADEPDLVAGVDVEAEVGEGTIAEEDDLGVAGPHAALHLHGYLEDRLVPGGQVALAALAPGLQVLLAVLLALLVDVSGGFMEKSALRDSENFGVIGGSGLLGVRNNGYSFMTKLQYRKRNGCFLEKPEEELLRSRITRDLELLEFSGNSFFLEKSVRSLGLLGFLRK